MRILVLPVLVAVLASLAVVAAAAAVSPEGRGVRTFFSDLRHGLSARFGKEREAEVLDDLEPVDTTMVDFFAATVTEEEAYTSVDGFANTLEHVVDGVARARR